MKPQNYELKRRKFLDAFTSRRSVAATPLKLSWSNWGFGLEPLEKSVRRLSVNGIEWIELHGNRYGKDLGYRTADTLNILKRHNVKAAGICGMFGPENDLSSNSGLVRQNAIDYIRRQLELCKEVGGSYLLVAPGAVGRPQAYDASEFERSVEALQRVADDFVKAGVRGAVEPIRSAEVSLVHTVADAKRYIAAVNHKGVANINGDVYHMLTEEANIAEAIIEAGDMLCNLHMADSNRRALGEGSLDVDAIIMALYAIGYDEGLRFVTPEPLGPGGDPYPAMHGKPDEALLDRMVAQTARYWREREKEVLSLRPA